MGRRIRRFYKEEDDPTVNLTPLIDVVFCILIVFIVIAPMLELDEVALSQAGVPGEKMAVAEAGPITIHVHQDNTIWLNRSPVSIDRLSLLLKDEKNKNPGARPQVFHDKRAHFGTYQMVKNAAEAAGFTEMDLILKPA